MKSANKKPVVFVGVALAALIVLPLLVLIFSKNGTPAGGNGGVTPAAPGEPASLVDFDLRQLSERAASLLENEIPEALQEGDVSLDFVADLNRLGSKAAEAMSRGKTDRAKSAYREVIEKAESALEAAALAEKARQLKDPVFEELKRLEYLNNAFGRTYSEAVELYNEGLLAINRADPAAAVDAFEMSSAVLGDLEAQAIQQIASLMDAAASALKRYDLDAARAAYGEVLRIQASHPGAGEGLVMIQALEEIGDAVREIEALEAEGKIDEALAVLESLSADQPQNPYLRGKRKALEEKKTARQYEALLAEADAAEAADDLDGAIAALEAALNLRPGADLAARLDRLKQARDARRLDVLLADGYAALAAGRYEAARSLYREAVALAPNSKEARTGLEKASGLYLAYLRFSQNLENASKFVEQGRFPLAAKFFNDAMASRPANLPESAVERRIRETLERQAEEVAVTVLSDRRTYVSLIGVFPPERFKEKDLRLYPDVYTLKGTRRGYRDVEVILKVNAENGKQEVEVVCTEKE